VAEPTQLTRDAYERLRAELDDLTTRGRVEIARKIEEARELGDLSENGDYQAAKDEQGRMEGRIGRLATILRDAVVIEAADVGSVSVGAVVELRYEGDTSTEKYLVGSVEERRSDVDGVLSPSGPLGEALLGRRAGDTVSYQAPSGTLTVEIVSIGS
jgi:transcription elongation factor GreA